MKFFRFIPIIAFIFYAAFTVSCQEKERVKNNETVAAPTEKPTPSSVPSRPLVTFIELGSVNCIPCKAMQPIMREIEKEYGNQVRVVFYDVWKPEQAGFATLYKIRAIPTQVFLDKDGNEYFRHEGYFPKAELVKVLKMQGVQ